MSGRAADAAGAGDRLGVSKERVRQIEERARGKLRAKLQELRDEAA